ncbi:hypothetical protein DRN52_07995 [Thermococci archaeon]|nr:MAG: hypothetical protein DRN52_07995 [Thermococci archaeon]
MLSISRVVMLVINIASTSYLVLIFNQPRYFSTPIALVSLTLMFLGMLTAIAALILHVIKTLAKRIETIEHLDTYKTARLNSFIAKLGYNLKYCIQSVKLKEKRI